MLASLAMPRRRDRDGPPDILSAAEIKQLRYRIAHLNLEGVRQLYDRALEECRLVYTRIASPRRSRRWCSCGSSFGSGEARRGCECNRGDVSLTTRPSHCDKNPICPHSCFRTATFVTYRPQRRQAHNPVLNNCFEHSMLSGVESMTAIVLVGVASFFVVLAIVVKARAAKPKKPEKWEKAQIVKRLLALSEREDIVNGISRQQPVSQSPTPRRRAAAAGTSPSRTV